MIDVLRNDPDAIRTLFPRIDDAALAQLPAETEQPLVLIRRSEAWANS